MLNPIVEGKHWDPTPPKQASFRMDGEDSPKEMFFFYESLSEIILL